METTDTKDHIKTETTRHEISEIKNDVAEIKEKTHQMYFALMGNDLTKDGGLISRIINVEAKIITIDEKILEIERQEEHKNFYLAIIWGFAGTLAGIIIYALLNYFLKK